MPSVYSGQKWSVVVRTADYTVVDTDFLIIASTGGGGFTVKLLAAPDEGRSFIVKKEGRGGTLVIDGNGHNIDGDPILSMPGQNDAVKVVFVESGFNEWVIV